MFDLWYSLGASVMFPDLFDEVSTQLKSLGDALGKPIFYWVNPVQFCDGSGTPLTNPNTSNPVAVMQDKGFIVSDTIDAARGVIRDEVRKKLPNAPPISLYTAGKFSQFIGVPAFDIKNNLTLANDGFQAAVAGLTTPRSSNFPAFLGVLLIDPQLAGSLNGLAGAPSPDMAKQALNEFQITDPGEIGAINAMVTAGNSFQTAQQNLLTGAGGISSWTDCSEQIFGWSPQTDAMVI